MFNCFCYRHIVCKQQRCWGKDGDENCRSPIMILPLFQRHVSQWIYLKEILIENSINDAASEGSSSLLENCRHDRNNNHHQLLLHNHKLSTRMMMMMMTSEGMMISYPVEYPSI
jgi:hypothetical protein